MNKSLTGGIDYTSDKTGAKYRDDDVETLKIGKEIKRDYRFIDSTTSAKISKFYYKWEPSSIVKTKIYEGEIEEINENYGLAVLRVDNNYIERRINIERLKACQADFEGAMIRVITKEKGEEVTYRFEKIKNEAYWEHPDEEFIDILKKLKGLRRSK